MTEHAKFEHIHKGGSHVTRASIRARRISQKAGVCCDEAQMEIDIVSMPIGGKRSTQCSTSFILSPIDARELALAVAPEFGELLKVLEAVLDADSRTEDAVIAHKWARSVIAKATGKA